MNLSELLLTDLPKTKSLVRATVFAMGLAAAASCGGDDVGPAPTCGPCCHGGTGCEDTSAPPPVDSGTLDSAADAATDAADATTDATADGAVDATIDAAVDAAADAP